MAARDRDQRPFQDAVADELEARWQDILARGKKSELVLRARYGGVLKDAEALQRKAIGAARGYGAAAVSAILPQATRIQAGRKAVADLAKIKVQPLPDKALKILDKSVPAKVLVGVSAERVGQVLGATRGAYHAADGFLDSALLVSRLGDPLDAVFSKPGDSAVAQLMNTADEITAKIIGVAERPQLGFGYLGKAVADTREQLDPFATPFAPSFSEEMMRRASVGANQGELAMNLFAVGYPATRTGDLTTLGRLGTFKSADAFEAIGHEPGLAAYLAEPYEGMGHHVIPRRTRLPDFLGGGPIPAAILESEFNVLKPPGSTKGEMFALHYGVGDRYYGGPLPRDIGGGGRGSGWSGRDLGFERFNSIDRLIYGSTPMMKVIAGTGMIGAGAIVDAVLTEDRAR